MSALYGQYLLCGNGYTGSGNMDCSFPPAAQMKSSSNSGPASLVNKSEICSHGFERHCFSYSPSLSPPNAEIAAPLHPSLSLLITVAVMLKLCSAWTGLASAVYWAERQAAFAPEERVHPFVGAMGLLGLCLLS